MNEEQENEDWLDWCDKYKELRLEAQVRERELEKVLKESLRQGARTQNGQQQESSTAHEAR